jgi:hypothetical protein
MDINYITLNLVLLMLGRLNERIYDGRKVKLKEGENRSTRYTILYRKFRKGIHSNTQAQM